MIAVIGSGPAGVSCALYLKRANLPVIVFTNHKSALIKAKKIENYYGVGSISGAELYQKGIDSLKFLEIPILEEEVLNIEFANPYLIETKNNHYKADTIVLATGTSKQNPKIENLMELEGKGVSFCATCDGYFFKGQDVAVLGNGDFAIHELSYLKNIASKVYLVTNGDHVEASNEIEKIETPIQKIVGNEQVEKILFQDGSILHVKAIFVANEYPDSNILAKKMGILAEKNTLLVNSNMETNISNIYACGDATIGTKQIASAVQKGMETALHIIERTQKKEE